VPVNILYCEGGKNSPDIRVLANLLAGVCMIKPAGSKYGLDRTILFIRQTLPGSVAAALRDRDFDQDDSAPVNSPINWKVRDNEKYIQIGWSWKRKEIENYLIDPEVVSHALGSKAPCADDYRAALEHSAKTIADYTAARIALSLSRKRLLPLKNCWGNAGINDKHAFPPSLSESDCRYGIKNIVCQYEQAQIVTEKDVLSSFEQLLPACRPEGQRFCHFLTFFSGKDLLFGMESELSRWGFQKPSCFQERIVKGIEKSPDNVWNWLPEWNQLRQLIQKTAF